MGADEWTIAFPEFFMHAASPLVSLIMSLFSVLLPTKMWYGPHQPITVHVDSKSPTSLVLTKFDGSAIGTKDAPGGDATVDLRTLFSDLNSPGTYVLFAVPKGKTVDAFVGTPIVIEVLANKQEGLDCIKIEPLQYEVMTTDDGAMTMTFYYDVAPNTVDSFLRLSSEGYYDGLTFHRILPGFVIQGGDPRGDGMGGPGYGVNAEFNAQPHKEGVLSMARANDPNSAGSQFFVCLDYAGTQQLDGKYTTFGKVVEGMDVVKKIGATPLKDANAGTPVTAPVIQKAEVFPVTPGHNPYAAMGLGAAAK
jgi:peptidyl-prolyl cis-trans isomerase B (cyclophilin B)